MSANEPITIIEALDYRWRWDFRLAYEDWYHIIDARWWYDHLEVMPFWIVIKARIVQ